MIQDSLGYLLAAASRLTSKEFNKTLKDYNITAPQWSVLNFLQQEGGFPQTQIGEQLHWDKATIGDIVENLLKKGLVTRTVSPQDRRAYRVCITPAGEAIIFKVLDIEARINADTCRGMSQEEAVLLHRLLKQAIENLS